MKKISIIYHHFPHYRAAVLRALADSKNFEYHFYGSTNDYLGIKAFKGDEKVTINPIKFINNEKGKMDIADFDEAVSSKYSATIIIGNPNMWGSWKAQSLAKRNGLSTAYWTHGWLKKENFIKSKIRNFYFNRADKVLTYGERAKFIADQTGFDTNKIQVIWNSLDFSLQTEKYNKYKDFSRTQLKAMIGMPTDKPILLTISRITDLCHYEWLVEALNYLNSNNKQEFIIWMIGTGPALSKLKALASSYNVVLYDQGEIYEEDEIAKHIMAADIVVSPGKLGLTGMHALAYGTPVVTHKNFDLQMPEVEAIVENVNGSYFKYGDFHDLANQLVNFYSNNSNKNNIRELCRNSLIGRFTPEDQVKLIDAAMADILNGK